MVEWPPYTWSYLHHLRAGQIFKAAVMLWKPNMVSACQGVWAFVEMFFLIASFTEVTQQKESFDLWQEKSRLVDVWGSPGSFFKPEKFWKAEVWLPRGLLSDDVTSQSCRFPPHVHPNAPSASPPRQSIQEARPYHGNEIIRKPNLFSMDCVRSCNWSQTQSANENSRTEAY